MEAVTRDPFLNGQIVLTQPKSGYRFSIDAVLLAHLAPVEPDDSIVDLGTGCGIVPLLMAYRRDHIDLVGVEIQPELAQLARQNVADNAMQGRVRIVETDMGLLKPADVGGSVDCVVTNPPYRKLDSGRINAHGQKAVARHEIKVDLQTVVTTAAGLLKRLGRFGIIYPAMRLVDLLAGMRSVGIEPKQITMIHSTTSTPARLVAVVGCKGGRPEVRVDPPLSIYEQDGSYTPAVEAMFTG